MVGKDLIMATLLGSGGGSSGSGGGGLPFGGYSGTYASGTFTVGGINNVEVEHNLGRTPVGCLLIYQTAISSSLTSYKCIVLVYIDTERSMQLVRDSNANKILEPNFMQNSRDMTGDGGYLVSSTMAYNATENTIKFGTTQDWDVGLSYSTRLGPGQYAWMVW